MSLFSDIISAVTSDEKKESPVNDSTGVTNTGLLNNSTGLLSKVIDTAGDIWATKEANKNSNSIGTVYPTGQKDPAATTVTTEVLSPTQAKAENIAKYLPWIIGGGVVVVGAFFLLAMKNASK